MFANDNPSFDSSLRTEFALMIAAATLWTRNYSSIDGTAFASIGGSSIACFEATGSSRLVCMLTAEIPQRTTFSDYKKFSTTQTGHLIAISDGTGLRAKKNALEMKELELRLQMLALASAPNLTVNALVIDGEGEQMPELFAADIASTVRFITSTTAMTGQMFILG